MVGAPATDISIRPRHSVQVILNVMPLGEGFLFPAGEIEGTAIDLFLIATVAAEREGKSFLDLRLVVVLFIYSPWG